MPMPASHLRSYLGKSVLITLTYFIAARCSLSIAIPPGNASPIWPASAIALYACVMWGKGMAPAIWAGAALANLTTSVSFISASAIGIGNTLEALTATLLIQRFVRARSCFGSGENVFKFVAIAALSSLIAASVGVFSLLLEGYIRHFADFARNWLTWWLGDTTGIIIATPLMMTWRRWFDRSWTGAQLIEFLTFSILLATTTHIIFGEVFGKWALAYVALIFVMWAAHRFDFSGVAGAIAVIAAIATGDTAQGLGPFATGNLNASLLLLQAFISVIGVSGLAQAALLKQRKHMEASLRVERDALEMRVAIRTAALKRDIEARKSAEKSLQESEERYRRVVELSPDGIFIVDASNTYVFASPAALSICGATNADQVVGKSAFDFFFPSFHPYLRERTQRLQRGDSVPPCEEKFIRLDGSVIDVEAHANHFPFRAEPASLVILRDITARKTAEQSLRLAAQVFENSQEGILIADQEKRIISINKAFTDITGYGEAEVIGKKMGYLRSDLHNDAFYEKIWRAIDATDNWQDELLSRRRSGEVYPAWASIAAVRDSERTVTNYLAVFSDISERKEAEARIRFMAEHDSLTALPSRELLFDRLGQAVAASRRNGTRLAVLFIDLDRFKHVNDSMGHDVGDKLLQSVADRLRKCVRSVDTVCRQGGDEFVVMLVDVGNIEQIAYIAGNMIESIAAPYQINGYQIIITSSIGISTYPNDAENMDDLVRNADIAMYHAKEIGRNNYQFFNLEMNKRIVERLTLESSLKQAIEKEEFILEYQPEMDMSSDRTIGVEALIRWQHPELGLLLPARFISIMEDCGLIAEIGGWVLRTACRQARSWFDSGLPTVVSVNLSVAQFSQKNLLRDVSSALQFAGLEARYLELEITESILVNDADTALHTLNSLRELGVRLAIDDFGTGYSSLSYLKRFKVDKLKIDQSFVRDISVDSDDGAIIGAIIAMAKSLNLKVIAEGVETVEQFGFLKALGCDEYQGHYSSRSLSPDAFASFKALH